MTFNPIRPGDPLKLNRSIRSQRTGETLPMEGKVVRCVENMGRTMILVDFGNGIEEYIFPEEVQLI